MSPVTRKQRALPPVKDEPNSVVMGESGTSSTKHKCKCPVEGCGKLLRHLGDLRVHYRTHTRKKPYECTFPSCNQTCADLSNVYTHIRKAHKQQLPKEYVKVRKEILDEEAKQLGIKEIFTGKVSGEGMSEKDESDAAVTTSTFPSFTTIHRTSTGHLICPFSECAHQSKSMYKLKRHYRLHCDRKYKPYRCVFPGDSCRYASSDKTDVEKHIRVKHFHVPVSIRKWNETAKDDDERYEFDFIETRTDWLEMEDTLFSSARIVSPPEVHTPRPFECTFPRCTKKFTSLTHLLRHRRSHFSQSKMPFLCSFHNCDYTASRKEVIFSHMQSFHLNVPAREYETDENEDDKDKLAPLLATVHQPTTSN